MLHLLPLRAPSVAALMLVFIGQALQPRRNLLFGLDQDVQQVLSDVPVFIIEERRGQSYTLQKQGEKQKGMTDF